MLGDTFHSGMGEGTLVNIKIRAVQLLAPITEQIRQALARPKSLFRRNWNASDDEIMVVAQREHATLTYYAADQIADEAMNRSDSA